MVTENGDLKEPVLVVDDEVGIRETLSEMISGLGLQVRTFETAEEALSALASASPFLILSDFKMAGMTGLDFCAEVRKSNSQLPFVLITGFADKQTALTGMNVGVTELIEKPFDVDAVIAMVRKHAQRRIEAIETELREMEEVTQLFAEEALDLLGDLDQLVLRLEEEPLDSVVVDSLFRKIHSVKGGAGAVLGGKLLAGLAHEFESSLSAVKRRELKPDLGCINLFLSCGDLCVQLIKFIKNRQEPGAEFRSQVEESVRQLVAIRTRTSDSAAATSASGATDRVLAPSAQGSGQGSGAAAKPEEASEDEGVWVTNEKLDSFMGLSGELIVLKNYFQMLIRDPEIRSLSQKLDKKHGEFAHSLNKLTDSLQNQISSIRKVRLERAFGKLQRVVRQTSQELGKKIKLVTNGLELEVDKNISKSLSASLIHMVRNSMDHGIESPDARREAGKPAEGTITISASESQGMILVTVSDDGGGINKSRVLDKAVKNGLIDESRRGALSDSEIFDLIFLPGFSTAENVSAVSGRGVGMDVVKSAVLAHHGRIRIESELGKGTTFVLELPVPKAVMVEHTVLSRAGASMFAVPLISISRITSCDQLQVNIVDHVRACQFDGRTVPLRTYEEYLEDRDVLEVADIQDKTAIVMQHKNRIFALLVDSIEDQLEAVIRPFDPIVGGLPGFKGTTVLGNDEIAYIVSPEEMVRVMAGKADEVCEAVGAESPGTADGPEARAA